MNVRRRERGALGNPILIGALTVLVTIVAVMLAYNANNGLPFVPKYDAARAGPPTRASSRTAPRCTWAARWSGSSTRSRPRPAPAASRSRCWTSSSTRSVQPLPVDSTFDVRLKGAIGLKYLAVTRGTSSQTWPNGATVPLTQSSAEVDLDQVLSMFDPPTRVGVAAIDDRLQRRAGRTRRRHQRRDRRVHAAGHPPRPGRAQPGVAQDRPRRLLARPRVVLAARWCRSPRTRPTCTATSTPRSARWRASRCRSCRTGSRRRRRRSRA